VGCFCHRPDRNCEKCQSAGVYELKLSKEDNKELKARREESERIHCFGCKDLVTESGKTPASCFGSYCKKYKKELEYYDGPLKLEVCYKKKYGRKQ
jgi:hypothetical protein